MNLYRNSIALAALLLAGCHSYHLADVQNGIVRSQTDATMSWLSTDVVTHSNTQKFPTCAAGIGAMPDGDEKDLCVDQVTRDVHRRSDVLDAQAYWYRYGYGYGGVPYGNSIVLPFR